MSGCIEIDKCDFCQEAKQVERTYLHPSKYVKEQGAFINKTLYNEGDYFIIVKTCSECGTPKSSQTEISDEEIEEYAMGYYNNNGGEYYVRLGAKWYREQLNNK